MTANHWRSRLLAATSVATRFAQSVGGAFATTLLPALQNVLERVNQSSTATSVVHAIELQRLEAPQRFLVLRSVTNRCDHALARFLSASPDQIATEAKAACGAASDLFAVLEELPAPRPLRRDFGILRSSLRALSRYELPSEAMTLLIAQLRAVKANDPMDSEIGVLLWQLETHGGDGSS